MIKKEKLFKVVSGAMILTVISVGGIALAGSKTKANTKTNQPKLIQQMKNFGPQGMGFKNFGLVSFNKFAFGFKLNNSEVIQTALSNLVKKGTLTQDQAKEVQDFLTKKAEEKKAEFAKIKNLTPEAAKKLLTQNLKSDIKLVKINPLEDLVDTKIITQVQADGLLTEVQKVSQKLQQEHQAKELETALNKLVAKGTFTQDKAKEVQGYLAKIAAERKAEFDKIKNSSPEGLNKLLISKKGAIKIKGDVTKAAGPFMELVTGKILTQEQASALANQIMEDKQGELKQKLSDALNSLVTKDTISQEQASKVIAKFDAVEKDHLALMEKLKAMTPAEGFQYKQDNLKEINSPLAQLVTEGIITADQAKAISSLLPLQGPRGGGMMMHLGNDGQHGPKALIITI